MLSSNQGFVRLTHNHHLAIPSFNIAQVCDFYYGMDVRIVSRNGQYFFHFYPHSSLFECYRRGDSLKGSPY
jgi:hypothetical protein